VFGGKRRFHYTLRSVRRQGRRDGREWRWKFWPPAWFFRESKSPYPPLNQKDTALFESEIKEAFENDAGILAKEWEDLDLRLKKRYCDAHVELELADASLKRETPEAQVAEGAYKEAEKKLLDVPAPAVSPDWANFWLLLIAAGEFPLNSMVFQLLGQEPRETYLIAAAMAIVIPLFAEVFGSALRQDSKTATDKALVALMPASALFLLGAIAYLRGEFMSLSPLLKELGFVLTRTQATALFLIMNVGLFLVASVISYESTYTDRRDYRTKHNLWKTMRAAFNKESREAREARSRYERARKELEAARQERQKKFESFLAEVRWLRESHELFIRAYRQADREARRDGQTPVCFRNSLEDANLPPSFLRDLDWSTEQAPVLKAS
jgi:hypothetical protein